MNVKEKEEFAVMKNEITHIKTDVTEIKKLLKEYTIRDEVKYLDVAKQYATKKELAEVKEQVNSNSKWIIKYGKDIAYLLAFVALFGKTQGWF